MARRSVTLNNNKNIKDLGGHHMPDGAQPVLDVRGLKTVFRTRGGEVHAVNSVSFHLAPGELLGVVGESGSGKSVTMMSLIGLLPSPPAEVRAGQVLLDGRDLLKIDANELRDVRGAKVGFVFQEPALLAWRRVAHNAALLSASLRAAGAEVIDLPLLEIAPLPLSSDGRACLLALDRYDGVLFVSTNAARLGLDAVAGLWPQWPHRRGFGAERLGAHSPCS